MASALSLMHLRQPVFMNDDVQPHVIWRGLGATAGPHTFIRNHDSQADAPVAGGLADHTFLTAKGRAGPPRHLSTRPPRVIRNASSRLWTLSFASLMRLKQCFHAHRGCRCRPPRMPHAQSRQASSETPRPGCGCARRPPCGLPPPLPFSAPPLQITKQVHLIRTLSWCCGCARLLCQRLHQSCMSSDN